MGSPKNDMTPLERNAGYIIGGLAALDLAAVRYLGAPIVAPTMLFLGAAYATKGIGNIAKQEFDALLSENRERRRLSIRNERTRRERTIHSMHHDSRDYERDPGYHTEDHRMEFE